MKNSKVSFDIHEIIEKARNDRKQDSVIFCDLYAIRAELMERRKALLGSHISLEALIRSSDGINEKAVRTMSQYLASQTTFYWQNSLPSAEEFCRRFYELALYAIGSGEVGDESVDDIIQLAGCLVRSRDTFLTVTKSLLPENMIGELFDFAEAYDSCFYSVSFEDAVLGGIATFLGALRSPAAQGENFDRMEEEAYARE